MPKFQHSGKSANRSARRMASPGGDAKLPSLAGSEFSYLGHFRKKKHVKAGHNELSPWPRDAPQPRGGYRVEEHGGIRHSVGTPRPRGPGPGPGPGPDTGPFPIPKLPIQDQLRRDMDAPIIRGQQRLDAMKAAGQKGQGFLAEFIRQNPVPTSGPVIPGSSFQFNQHLARLTRGGR